MRKKSASHKIRTKGKNRSGKFLIRFSLFLFGSIVSFTTASAVLHLNQAQPTCANSQSCKSDLSTRIENNMPGVFEGRIVYPPRIDTSININESPVLGANTNSGAKHIYVDLSKQTLYAFQGQTQVFKTLISSGRWAPTPVGNFHIWEKLIATRMTGGEGASAYDLPNVPYVMYFYNDFGLHGAYWHDNFGHTMSHGCVNMRTVDAKTLYDWADGPTNTTLGTAVSICDSLTDSHQCVQNNSIN